MDVYIFASDWVYDFVSMPGNVMTFAVDLLRELLSYYGLCNDVLYTCSFPVLLASQSVHQRKFRVLNCM